MIKLKQILSIIPPGYSVTLKRNVGSTDVIVRNLNFMHSQSYHTVHMDNEPLRNLKAKLKSLVK